MEAELFVGMLMLSGLGAVLLVGTRARSFRRRAVYAGLYAGPLGLALMWVTWLRWTA